MTSITFSVKSPFTRLQQPEQASFPHEAKREKRELKNFSPPLVFHENTLKMTRKDFLIRTRFLIKKKIEALTHVYQREYALHPTEDLFTEVDETNALYNEISQTRQVVKATKCLGHLFYQQKERFLLGSTSESGPAKQIVMAESSLRTLKYKWKAFLGCGSYGAAFLAEDADKKKVVLKATHIVEPFFVNEIRNESGIIRAIEHVPHIPRFVDAYPTLNIFGKQSFVQVSDYAPLTSLFQFLNTQAHPIPMDQVAAFAWKMFDSLENLHKKGYIHMDLKPENLLFGELPFPENAKEQREMIEKMETPRKELLKDSFLQSLCRVDLRVIDFGCAKTKDEMSLDRYICTGSYRHPSVVGSQKFHPEYDYYSLGTILFEMYARKQLFLVGYQVIDYLNASGIKTFNDILVKENDDPEAVGERFLHQLVRLHVAQAILDTPNQKVIAEMEPALRDTYYVKIDEKYVLKPLPLKDPSKLDHVNTMILVHKNMMLNRLKEQPIERSIPTEVHNALVDLIFNKLLKSDQVDPQELQNHLFFQLVAFKDV